MEDRMDQSGVKFDVTAIGYGMRGATLEPVVERFEGEYIQASNAMEPIH